MSFIKKISKKIVTLASLGIMSILPFNSEQVNQIAEKTLNQEKNPVKIVNQLSLSSTAFAATQLTPEEERFLKTGIYQEFSSYKRYNEFLGKLYDPNAYKDLTQEEKELFYDELRIESDKRAYDILSYGIESFDEIIKNQEFTEELNPWFKDKYEKIFFEGLIGFDKNNENYDYKMNDYYLPVATGMHELKDVDEETLEKIIEESRLNVAPLYYTQDMFPGDEKFLGFSNITFDESKEIAKENKVVFYLPSTEAFVVVKDDYSDYLKKRFEELSLYDQIKELRLDQHHNGYYAMNSKVYFEYFLPIVYNDLSRAIEFELDDLRIMRVDPHGEEEIFESKNDEYYYGKGVFASFPPEPYTEEKFDFYFNWMHYLEHTTKTIYDFYFNREKVNILFGISPNLITEAKDSREERFLRFESDKIESGISTYYSFILKLKDQDHFTLIYPDELYQLFPDAKVFLDKFYYDEEYSIAVEKRVNEVTTGFNPYYEPLRMNSWYNYYDKSFEDSLREFVKNKLIELRLPGDTMGIIAIPDEMIIFEKDPVHLDTDEKSDNLRQTWKDISMDLMNLLYFYEQNDNLELLGYSSKDLNQLSEDNFKIVSQGLNFQPNYIYNPFFRELKSRIFQAGIESSTGFLNPLLAVTASPSFAEQMITQEEDYPVMNMFNKQIKSIDDLLDMLEYVKAEQNKNEITKSNPAYDLAMAALYKEALENPYILNYGIAFNNELGKKFFSEDSETALLRARELSYSKSSLFFLEKDQRPYILGLCLNHPTMRDQYDHYAELSSNLAFKDAYSDKIFSELKDFQRTYPLPKEQNNETIAKFLYETYNNIVNQENQIISKYINSIPEDSEFRRCKDYVLIPNMFESINAAYIKMLNQDSPFWQWYAERADKDQDAYAYQFIRAIDEITGNASYFLSSVLTSEAFIKNPHLITEYHLSPKRAPNNWIFALTMKPEFTADYEKTLREFLDNSTAITPSNPKRDSFTLNDPPEYWFNFRINHLTYFNLNMDVFKHREEWGTVPSYLTLSSDQYSKFLENNPLIHTKDNMHYITTPPFLINDFYKNYYLNLYKTYPENILKDVPEEEISKLEKVYDIYFYDILYYKVVYNPYEYSEQDPPNEKIKEIEEKYQKFLNQ